MIKIDYRKDCAEINRGDYFLFWAVMREDVQLSVRARVHRDIKEKASEEMVKNLVLSYIGYNTIWNKKYD